MLKTKGRRFPLAAIFLLIISVICSRPYKTRALDHNSYIMVLSGYEFEDGSIDVWGTATGVYLGDGIILSASAGIAFDDVSSLAYQDIIREKSSIYATQNINLNDFNTVLQSMRIYIVLPDGRMLAGTLHSSDHEAGIVLIGVKTAGLNLSAASVSESRSPTTVTASYYTSAQLGEIANALSTGPKLFDAQNVFEEEVSSIVRDSQLEVTGLQDTFSLGAILSDGNEIYGIITETVGGIKYAAGGTLIRLLLSGNTSSSEDLAEALSELENKLANCKGLDVAAYTEESAKRLSEAILSAELSLSSHKSKLSDVRAAIKELEDAEKSLVPMASTEEGSISILKLIIFLVLALSLIGSALWFFLLRDVFKKKKEETDDEKEAKKEQKSSRIAALFARRDKVKNEQMQGYGGEYARSAQKQRLKDETEEDSDGTTKLNKDDESGTALLKKKQGYLIVEANGDKILLDKSLYTIGREKRKVDYQLNFSSISRTHCAIRYEDGEYFIEDLRSSNGTTLNETAVNPGSPLKLKDGDSLKLADIKLTFRSE